MKYTHKRNLMSIAMATLVLVALCAVCASPLSVSAAPGSTANVQSNPGGIVGAPVVGGAAVCAQDASSLDLFARGVDTAIWWSHGTPGMVAGTWIWSPWKSLGGRLTADPAATSTAAGNIVVYGRGTDGVLWSTSTANAGDAIPTWSTWTKFGGNLFAGTGPAACNFGPTRIDLFVTGTDGALWHTWTGKTGWESLGGKLTSSPGATGYASDKRIGVFARGTDGALWYKFFAPGWAPWKSQGGQILAGTSPTAYNWGATRIGCLVTGTDYALFHIWNGVASHGWEGLGGYLTSSPAATSRSTGTIDVFARGGSSTFAVLWGISYPVAPDGWGDWEEIGGLP